MIVVIIVGIYMRFHSHCQRSQRGISIPKVSGQIKKQGW
jgi:hypothetical protein